MNNIKKAVLISLGGLILLTSGCGYERRDPLPQIEENNGFIAITKPHWSSPIFIKIDKIDKIDTYKAPEGYRILVYVNNQSVYSYIGSKENRNKIQNQILEIVGKYDN